MYFDYSFNPAGFPPPKGDPQTVLRNYMTEHNCSESEAKAELEKMYGKPQMPGMNPNGSIDMTFSAGRMAMPMMWDIMSGFNAGGGIDFSSHSNQTTTSYTSTASQVEEAEIGSKNYYENLVRSRSEQFTKSELKQIKKETEAYKKELQAFKAEYKDAHRQELKAELKSIKRDDYLTRKEYKAAREAVKNKSLEYAKAKLQEKYPDKDIEAIMFNIGRLNTLAYLKDENQFVRVPSVESSQTTVVEQTENTVEPEVLDGLEERKPSQDEKANLDKKVLAKVNQMNASGKSSEEIAMQLHNDGVSDDLIPAYFKEVGLKLPEQGPQRQDGPPRE